MVPLSDFAYASELDFKLFMVCICSKFAEILKQEGHFLEERDMIKNIEINWIYKENNEYST